MVPAWAGRRKKAATEWVRRVGEAEGAPCCICRQSIDYALRYPDPGSCSVQHLQPQRDFPHLRWVRSNWAPAHLLCNTSQGVNPAADLGLMSEG